MNVPLNTGNWTRRGSQRTRLLLEGYRGEDAKEKASTMRTYWVPGVNNLGSFGRWAFAEFTRVFEIEAELNDLVDLLVYQSAEAGGDRRFCQSDRG